MGSCCASLSARHVLLRASVLLCAQYTAVSSSAAASSDVEWNFAHGGHDWTGECSGSLQSPIDIAPSLAVEADTTMKLLYNPWHRSEMKSVEKTHAHLRLDFLNPDGGLIQVGPAYDDIDEYVVQSMQVHMPSEHQVHGKRWPAEVQIWHEPALSRQLAGLRKEALQIRFALAALGKEEKDLREEAKKLQDLTRGEVSFPDVKTEKDWIASGKAKTELEADKVKERALALRDHVVELERRIEELVAKQLRPMSSRRVAISLFFRHLPSTVPLDFIMQHPRESDENKFLRWLAGVNASSLPVVERGTEPATAVNASGCDIRALLDEGVEGTAKSSVIREHRKAYTYDGSLTRPPCTPDVRWFISSDPFIASAEDLEALWHAGSGSKLSSNKSLSWKEGLELTLSRDMRPLGDRKLSWVVLGTKPFEKPLSRLTNQAMGLLPWYYINLYCLTFLLLSVLMLTVAFMICTKSCCRDEESRELAPSNSSPRASVT